MGLKLIEVKRQTGCSDSQLHQWVQDGFLDHPKGGRYSVWADNTTDKIPIIRASMADNRNVKHVALELFMNGLPLAKPEALRQALIYSIDARLKNLFLDRPTVPSEPLPSDRRQISRQVERLAKRAKVDIPPSLKAPLDRALELSHGGLSQLYGVPRRFGEEDNYMFKEYPWHVSPSLYELKALVDKASPDDLEKAVSDSNAFIGREIERLEREIYAMGFSSRQVTYLLLSGHACKQPHTLAHALRPLVTLQMLHSPDAQEITDNVIEMIKKAQKLFSSDFQQLPQLLPQRGI